MDSCDDGYDQGVSCELSSTEALGVVAVACGMRNAEWRNGFAKFFCKQ